ncbi:FeoB-associated Cys-rich membrane protein [Sporanaerobium hydrogeniformans]|uniref:FeoB-associated Cys-rich membrane protein n=1 Tax=Sporanaerobium hydrogeniformans TaxID=3072179 RepID=A0AC61D6H9_9FIRM|nr:FeoB-associated Cys-rich membrane protein [Sporanaerobium hydrogeniformans]
MVSVIILGVILLYVLFVIYKKVKGMKEGKFCSCGCESCPAQKKCKN